MNLFKSIRLKRLLNTLNSTTTHKQQVKAIKALGKSGSLLAFDPLVKKLKEGYPEAAEELGDLTDFDRNKRISVAKALDKLGETLWEKITEFIQTSHTDFNTGESGLKCDYHHFDTLIHTDTGIGLEIPQELKI